MSSIIKAIVRRLQPLANQIYDLIEKYRAPLTLFLIAVLFATLALSILTYYQLTNLPVWFEPQHVTFPNGTVA